MPEKKLPAKNTPRGEFRGELREYRHDNGDVLAFQFVRSARKTLGLYVSRDGSVQVRAPLRVPLAQVYIFLHERWVWLQSQRQRFLEQPAVIIFTYKDGEPFLHLGQQKMLRVFAAPRNYARAVGDELHIGMTAESRADASALPALVGNWQRREALNIFPERVALCHAALAELNLKVTELKIRKMRSRWGSCTKSGTITLSLELVRMPLECIDYVVVHELCHLREFNHSPRFYELQARFFPDWKVRKQQLNELARQQYEL
jgi:predicted metal-dependent hydrolase